MAKDKYSLLSNIKRQTPYLSPALKRIAGYVAENPEKVKSLKIQELASECEVSEATVTKFVKEFRIKTYQELKIILAELSITDMPDTSEEKYVYDEVTKGDSIENVIGKISYRALEAIEETKKIINPKEIEKAVSAISSSKMIIIYGVGTSTLAAETAKMRFYRIGKECIVYSDPAHQAVSASLFDQNNVSIGISNSGRASPTVDALRLAKENGATTICITSSSDSPINRFSDIKLYTADRKSTFFQDSLVSRVAQILIIDILYASCAIRHYKKSIDMLERSAAALVKFLQY